METGHHALGETGIHRRSRSISFAILITTLTALGTYAYGQSDGSIVQNTADEETAPELADPELNTWDEPGDFSELDLEELMGIEVSVVTGDDQSIFETPAAVFVITSEDIRRGGFRTIPEALRIVPGLHVARVSANSWAISARGFSARFASRMLVSVDGRAIYTDLFSGTVWNYHELPIREVDRIEVIRGPGATVWGANAVNGVINIVTKNARKTQGWTAEALVGDPVRGEGYLSYGGSHDERIFFRVYGSVYDREGFEFEDGTSQHGDSTTFSLGGRLDGRLGDRSKVMLSARHQSSHFGEAVRDFRLTAPFVISTRRRNEADISSVLAKYEHLDDDDRVSWSLQAFADRDRFDNNGLRGVLGTYDVEFRQFIRAIKNHELVWGVGYRRRYDNTRSETLARVRFQPVNRDTDKYSAFVQDTIAVHKSVDLLIGTKVEKNEYTGWEVQPSARATWRIDSTQVAWASISRAVRTPSRSEHDLTAIAAISPPPPAAAFIFIQGDRRVDSEILIAYELGYRCRPTKNVTLDAAIYYSDYDDFITASSGANPTILLFNNSATAETFGGEIGSTVQATEDWRLFASYSFIHVDIRGGSENLEDDSPDHSFTLRSAYDVTSDLELNASGYYVDNLSDQDVSSYFRLDLGLTWRPRPDTTISIWGQNLTENHHVEQFDSFNIQRNVDVPRSLYAQIQFDF